jgi:hypothetical protein
MKVSYKTLSQAVIWIHYLGLRIRIRKIYLRFWNTVRQ